MLEQKKPRNGVPYQLDTMRELQNGAFSIVNLCKPELKSSCKKERNDYINQRIAINYI